MAPRTNSGSAHPVSLLGQQDSVMMEKDTNDATANISVEPTALQLRFLETLEEVASEKNSTTFSPILIDLLTPFIKVAEKQDEDKDKS